MAKKQEEGLHSGNRAVMFYETWLEIMPKVEKTFLRMYPDNLLPGEREQWKRICEKMPKSTEVERRQALAEKVSYHALIALAGMAVDGYFFRGDDPLDDENNLFKGLFPSCVWEEVCFLYNAMVRGTFKSVQKANRRSRTKEISDEKSHRKKLKENNESGSPTSTEESKAQEHAENNDGG